MITYSSIVFLIISSVVGAVYLFVNKSKVKQKSSSLSKQKFSQETLRQFLEDEEKSKPSSKKNKKKTQKNKTTNNFASNSQKSSVKETPLKLDEDLKKHFINEKVKVADSNPFDLLGDDENENSVKDRKQNPEPEKDHNKNTDKLTENKIIEKTDFHKSTIDETKDDKPLPKTPLPSNPVSNKESASIIIKQQLEFDDQLKKEIEKLEKKNQEISDLKEKENKEEIKNLKDKLSEKSAQKSEIEKALKEANKKVIDYETKIKELSKSDIIKLQKQNLRMEKKTKKLQKLVECMMYSNKVITAMICDIKRTQLNKEGVYGADREKEIKKMLNDIMHTITLNEKNDQGNAFAQDIKHQIIKINSTISNGDSPQTGNSDIHI